MLWSTHSILLYAEDDRLANAELRLRAAEAPPPAGSTPPDAVLDGEAGDGVDTGAGAEAWDEAGMEKPADRNPEGWSRGGV